MKPLVATLAFCTLTLLALYHYQQKVIHSLLEDREVSLRIQADTHRQLAELRRDIEDLQHERAKRLDRVARQVDILIAMRRGPRHAKKLLADRKIRFYLGY